MNNKETEKIAEAFPNLKEQQNLRNRMHEHEHNPDLKEQLKLRNRMHEHRIEQDF